MDHGPTPFPLPTHFAERWACYGYEGSDWCGSPRLFLNFIATSGARSNRPADGRSALPRACLAAGRPAGPLRLITRSRFNGLPTHGPTTTPSARPLTSQRPCSRRSDSALALRSTCLAHSSELMADNCTSYLRIEATGPKNAPNLLSDKYMELRRSLRFVACFSPPLAVNGFRSSVAHNSNHSIS